ncbi:uncharacterized protein LOC105843081 isoform X1 [Hydra vulgaris]|uniref:uncharacterized protein LOC105843081 isoform X1 n=1 Tax=Hydra vulgaris TaxID=6087 RepID=UPI001F5EE67E|nr:serine/threonine-protein kinase Nek2-like [Hydra vulgaris]
MDEYNQLKILGKGSFGCVWLVKSNKTNINFVIKEISITGLKLHEQESAVNEVKILATLRHKNIIRYQHAFIQEAKLCIVMEYADDGDLSQKIKLQNGNLFLELQIIDWFVQILIAIKYIHSLNILHRDIKSQNIFLTKTSLVKIGDFGVSRFLNGSLHQAQTAIGTPFYLSPEICRRKPYNNKSDMWSLGVLLYELSTLKHPFQADDFSGLVIQIIQGKYQPIPGCYGPLLHDLLLVLLQVRPTDRPTASQLLKIPSLQPHVESYLRRVRHKEAPVILDLSLSRSSLTEQDSTVQLNVCKNILYENIRCHSERTSKHTEACKKQSRTESLNSKENAIQFIQNSCQNEKIENIEYSKEKTRTKSLINRKTPLKTDNMDFLEIKDKIKPATYKDFTENFTSPEHNNQINKTYNKYSILNKTKTIINEAKAKNLKTETKEKTAKNKSSTKSKSPKTNFIERNRNIALSLSSTKKDIKNGCSENTATKKKVLSPTLTPSIQKSPHFKCSNTLEKKNHCYLKYGKEPFRLQEYDNSPKRLPSFNSRKLEYCDNFEMINQPKQKGQTADLFEKNRQKKIASKLVGYSLINIPTSCENNDLNMKTRPPIYRSQTDIMYENAQQRKTILSDGLKLADKIKLKISKRLSSASDASKNYHKLCNDNEELSKESRKVAKKIPTSRDSAIDDLNPVHSITLTEKSETDETFLVTIKENQVNQSNQTSDNIPMKQRTNISTAHTTTYTKIPVAQDVAEICKTLGAKAEKIINCLRQFQTSSMWKTLVDELADDEYIQYLPLLFKFVLNEERNKR